ncbi:MAG: SRPBCC domain-containing protein [Acidobacteriia bacterium]|nr:SRPBCC domain-containing protein [Terriglobia bacterium]
MTPEADAGKVVVRRRIQATREELFDAWTDPEGMREWMCPGDVVSAEVQMDVRVGGALLILMRSPTELHEHRGEFTVIDRPSKLAFTWISKSTDFVPALVTVEFITVTATESELILTHEGILKKEVRDRYQNGWGQIASRLEQSLRGAGR